MLHTRSRRSATTFTTASVAFVAACAAAGVPAPLYVVYQQTYGLSTVVLTGAFAIYILPLLAALLCCGALSDHLGRRRVAVPALLAGAAGSVVLATVDSAAPLLVGRAVQGLSVGLALSALGAFVVDLVPPSRPGLAGAVTSGAPPGGIALGALTSGIALQVVPASAPVLSFVVTASVLTAAAVAVVFLPETVVRAPGAVRSLRPVVRVPPTARRVFPPVCLLVAGTYVLGGFTQALAPSLVVSVLDGSTGFAGPLSGALAVAVYHLVGPVAGLAANRLSAARALAGGAAGLVVGIGGYIAAIAVGSFAAYLVAAVVAGAGFGVAFAGAMRTLLDRSPEGTHAGTLAAIYLYCYLAAAVASLLAGVAVDLWGLASVAVGLCAVVAVMVVVGGVGSVLRMRRR
ncbi:putative MFS family arabinose efflux permease [Actinomycetospora succinea]|uniref:Putative MFS family arabinose efflux permease n=1 Tax=Actinomycetospora succinea TaxID=663603 RepID=A0A4R6VJS5_9PSEU|nr:MFS transporter [Actinomycetospora succinea]TDQ58779.1 putative MFS family arabinose efflux permease [Actinomycetospora succinea]